MVRLLSICALSVVTGAGIGWALYGPRSADTNAPATPAAAQVALQLVSQRQAGAPSGLDSAQLRAAIGAAPAFALTSQAASNQRAMTAAKENAPASPEVLARRQQALQDIQTLIATSRWGGAERAEFQRKFAMLDAEQARQALQQVVSGLNNGTIHALTGAPL